MSVLRSLPSLPFQSRGTTTLPIYISCLYLLLFVVLATQAFEYSAYCQHQCEIGRGGNLCKCNAVHFKGKRTGPSGLFTQDKDEAGMFGGVARDVMKSYDQSEVDGREDVMSLLSYIINNSDKGLMSQGSIEDELSMDGENDDYSNRVQKRLLAQMKSPYRKWYKSGLRPFRKA